MNASLVSPRLLLVLGLPAALSLVACGGGGSSSDGGTGHDSSTPPTDGSTGTDAAMFTDSGARIDTGTRPDSGACVPGVEICGDRMDQDCDGHDTGCGDNDMDRFDACTVADQMSGDLSGCDCDDAHDTAYPGHPELCDDLDNDCNGRIDEAAACCAGCAGMSGRGDICATDGSCACSTAPGMALCGSGQTCCSSGCTDINSDKNNCGYCGTECTSSSDTCNAGSCGCGTGPVCDFVYICTAGACGM